MADAGAVAAMGQKVLDSKLQQAQEQAKQNIAIAWAEVVKQLAGKA